MKCEHCDDGDCWKCDKGFCDCECHPAATLEAGAMQSASGKCKVIPDETVEEAHVTLDQTIHNIVFASAEIDNNEVQAAIDSIENIIENLEELKGYLQELVLE